MSWLKHTIFVTVIGLIFPISLFLANYFNVQIIANVGFGFVVLVLLISEISYQYNRTMDKWESDAKMFFQKKEEDMGEVPKPPRVEDRQIAEDVKKQQMKKISEEIKAINLLLNDGLREEYQSNYEKEIDSLKQKKEDLLARLTALAVD